MPPIDHWFKVACGLMLIPPLLYSLVFYSFLAGDVMRVLRVNRGGISTTLVNASGPLLFLAVYVMAVAAPALGLAAVVDRVTDA